MSRNFKNWLESYLEYTKNEYVPGIFDLWVGLSTISGALERKTWIANRSQTYYPNTYVLLVGGPGSGKSSAIKHGTRLLERIRNEVRPDFRVISGGISQAGLVKAMKPGGTQFFQLGPMQYPYWSAYYYHDEGSDSGLQQLAGDFNATLTSLYDCNDNYRKNLKYEDLEAINPSLCMLSGTTFEFLKVVMTQNSIGGGLASRIIFPITNKKELSLQEASRLGQFEASDETPERKRFYNALYEDLVQINKLAGSFHTTSPSGVHALHDEWNRRFTEHFNALHPESKMRDVLIRKPTNLMKILMLLSAADRDDLLITEKHMEQAILILEDVTKDTARILSSALMSDRNSQAGISHFIMNTIKNSEGPTSIRQMKARFTQHGSDASRFDVTLKQLQEAGFVLYDSNLKRFTLAVDPDTQL